MCTWQWSSYEELSRDDLFEILRARQTVFVVEQKCPYQDIDDLDRVSWHLMLWDEVSVGKKELTAYSRVIPPGEKYPEPSIGRVLTLPSARGEGKGRALIQEAIKRTKAEFPHMPIRISAQQYLQRFYANLGFQIVSNPYDEDGITHVEMLRDETA
ncbi:MAG: GNAT family N-acetyltransferase [Phormidesmis sp.]